MRFSSERTIHQSIAGFARNPSLQHLRELQDSLSGTMLGFPPNFQVASRFWKMICFGNLWQQNHLNLVLKDLHSKGMVGHPNPHPFQQPMHHHPHNRQDHHRWRHDQSLDIRHTTHPTTHMHPLQTPHPRTLSLRSHQMLLGGQEENKPQLYIQHERKNGGETLINLATYDNLIIYHKGEKLYEHNRAFEAPGGWAEVASPETASVTQSHKPWVSKKKQSIDVYMIRLFWCFQVRKFSFVTDSVELHGCSKVAGIPCKAFTPVSPFPLRCFDPFRWFRYTILRCKIGEKHIHMKSFYGQWTLITEGFHNHAIRAPHQRTLGLPPHCRNPADGVRPAIATIYNTW